MAIRTILRYPDPLLGRPCAPVVEFDDTLRQLADDLLDTMHAAPGVGITAAHVGILLRLVVIELERAQGPRIYVNPEVTWSSADTVSQTEGSVSMPGATEEVVRPSAIRIRYQALDGAVHEEEADGFLSICLQHEIDQLDGIFWLQRLSRLKRERLTKKWQKGKT